MWSTIPVRSGPFLPLVLSPLSDTILHTLNSTSRPSAFHATTQGGSVQFDPMAATKLMELPTEILHHIADNLHVTHRLCLVSFASTCQRFREVSLSFLFRGVTVTVRRQGQLRQDVDTLPDWRDQSVQLHVAGFIGWAREGRGSTRCWAAVGQAVLRLEDHCECWPVDRRVMALEPWHAKNQRVFRGKLGDKECAGFSMMSDCGVKDGIIPDHVRCFSIGEQEATGL